MTSPLRLPDHHPVQRWIAACAIGILTAAIGVALWSPAKLLGGVRTLDDVFYDSLYRLRPTRDLRGGDAPIVIVAVDDVTMQEMRRAGRSSWPWPRRDWGQIVTYLEGLGAKAVVFDLLFDEPSARNPEGSDLDDRSFAEAIEASGTPTVLAKMVRPGDGDWGMAPPVVDERRRVVGAANASGEATIRSYAPVVHGFDSLALAAAKQAGVAPPDWARSSTPFLLHYYGPHARGGEPATFRYVRAYNVLAAAHAFDLTGKYGFAPDTFKDKIVFVAAITAGTYDLKAAPLSDRYPGVEVHATALQDMIDAKRVTPVGAPLRVLLLGLGCFAAALGTVIPARVPLKVAGGLSGPALILGLTAALFLAADVRWHPPAAAMIAATLAAFAGLAWSYLTEVRQRRLIARAFAQYVSKEVVEAMLKDPRKIALTGDRREMTVMFTDIANFTTVSERLDVEAVARLLNYYLDEMSRVILTENGTLDKYIGDSIMCFWNAPTDQADHARRACRAALGMREREKRVADELKHLAEGEQVYSRAGINSGPMSVGNMGSATLFNYTVLGDAVNLASRLEGANKLYGTRALMTSNTAKLVRDQFVVRKVDSIRVKGRAKPMAIYELLAEGKADDATARLVSTYEQALALYQSSQFDAAYELLRTLSEDFPGDGPTATLAARIDLFRASPPPPDWDGVYVAKDK